MQKQLLAKTKGRLKTIMKKLKDQKNRRTLRTKTMRKAYANATRYIVTGLAVITVMSFPIIHSILTASSWFEPISQTPSGNIENQESIDVEMQDTTQSVTTIPHVTKSTIVTSQTTTITSTTQITTTEKIVDEGIVEDEAEEYYEYEEEEEYYYEDESEDKVYEEPDYSYDSEYSGSFKATYYSGSYGSYGSSGRDLISGYSIASSYFPEGSIVYISGGGLDGCYRVDDYCPSGDNIIDIFYTYDSVPSNFAYDGVYYVDAYLVE